MNKTTKIILYSLLSVGAVAAAAQAYIAFAPITSVRHAIIILRRKNPARLRQNLIAMDKGFVIAWAMAARDGEKEFGFDNKIFSTETGRVKQ